MQAVGNDFVVVEQVAWPADTDWSAQAIRLCDRKFGIGADGLLVVCPSEAANIRMRMFNPDGTEDMCGNGLRCVIRYGYEHRLFSRELYNYPEPEDRWRAHLAGTAETLDGVHAFELSLESWAGDEHLDVLLHHAAPQGGWSGVDLEALEQDLQVVSPDTRHTDLDNDIELNPPKFTPADLPMTAPADLDRILDYPLPVEGYGDIQVSTVNTGSTHTVLWVDTLPDDARFFDLSPRIENHPLYPERTSVLWAMVDGQDENDYDLIRARIWERGAGETLGCGTGACAIVVLAQVQSKLPRADRPKRISVRSPGGTLQAFWKGGPNDNVRLSGPAFIVYEGHIPYRPE